LTQYSDAAVSRLEAVIARQRSELDRARVQVAGRMAIDLAAGILMEQLGCSADEARAQLEDLADRASISVPVLAAQIARLEPADDDPDHGWRRLSLVRPQVEDAHDADEVAAAMLEEVLRPAGAVAVVLWRTEPDGGMELAGQAGLSRWEASRWRRLHPDMTTLAHDVAHNAVETWWPAGRPGGDDRPLIGSSWPDGARAALPLRQAGRVVGVMVVCWPGRLDAIRDQLRRQLIALAELAGRAIRRCSAEEDPADPRISSVIGLLDNLLEGIVVASAIRDEHGRVADFRIDHVKGQLPGSPACDRQDWVGVTLLEAYPWAAVPGSLLDHCTAALETGQPRFLAGDRLLTAAWDAAALVAPAVRIAQFYDGVAISWREGDHADRLAALLQHAQRLGRIGAWEEDLRTGDVRWGHSTYQLFGLQQGTPVSISELDQWVPADDLPALRGFRQRLQTGRSECAAAFRIIRADESERQIRAYAEPVTDAAGAVTSVRGAYQDVSADYHTRLAFAAAREQLADTEARAAEDQRLALRLQEAITPRASEPPATPGLEVAARYRPSESGGLVGGDWYDVMPLPGERTMLVIGDTAGHGLDAVTGMVALRNALRGLAATGASPASLLGWLNTAACSFIPNVIGTAICARFDSVSRSLNWARAGHMPPILIRDGHARLLDAPSDLLLGADPSEAYAESAAALMPGDTVLFYTDGLVERRREPIDLCIASLLRAASGCYADIGQYADHLVDHAPSDTEDDACLLAVRVQPGPQVGSLPGASLGAR
jgi:serine phosphatase RsbU (regulator of sigma subunit)